MKKIITLLFMVGLFITAYPQSYHTITIDGTINTSTVEWSTTNEQFTTSTSNTNAYLTWDADSIYVAWPQVDFDGYNQACFVAIDVDPLTTNGSANLGYEQWFRGSTVNVNFNADILFMVKENNSSLEEHTYAYNNTNSNWEKDGANSSTDYRSAFNHSYGNENGGKKDIELSIGRSSIGLDNGKPFRIVAYCKDLDNNSGWGYLHRAIPGSAVSDGINDKTFTKDLGYLLIPNINPNDTNYIDVDIKSFDNDENDSLWNTANNWSNNTVPDSSTLVIIPDDQQVTISASKTDSVYDLLIESSATGTGSLIINGTLNIENTFSMQRYMTNYTTNANGWHLLSAPVSNFTISGSDFVPTSGVDDLYEWDESTNTWLNYNGGTFGDTEFQTGKGYLVAYSSAATKEFTGNINTGTFAKSLSYTSTSPHKGLNLLGNPYTSAIDWDLLTKSSNVDGSVYVLRASDGAYISWNGSAGDITDGIIPAMQGYFVKTTATGESVTMEAADQVHSTTNFYKSGKELAENTFYITVNGNNGESNAYIQFRDGATKTFDHAFDAYKLFGYSTAPQIYTNDGENIYSINCLPSDIQSYNLPVGVKISASGEYQISFNGIENVSDNFDIKLEDLQTGEQTKVYPETTYKFTANEGDNSNRFILHFYNVTSTPEINEPNNKALIYSYNNNIIVKATDKQLNGKVEIINILGQTMKTKSVSNSNFLTINTNLNKGVYIVRYSATDGYTQAQKVIIN